MQKIIIILNHLYWLILALLIRCLSRVQEKRILCWSYNYTKYACNPKYITEYLLFNHPGEYEIYWCFDKNIDVKNVPNGINIVRRRTLKYLWILYTSKYLFSNSRIYLSLSSFLKKRNQKYIMTWHAGMGLKKVEKDAMKVLPNSYIRTAKYDSSICNLMLSGSRYMTATIKRAFWYDGEILEKGTPRNDMLFKDHSDLKKRILRQYDIPENSNILLYAPTFRADYGTQYYKLNWDDVIPVLEKKLCSPLYIFIRLHPNFCLKNILLPDISNKDKIRNLTLYDDMQELICIADILVTDYSSSMFDFSLQNKPCFLYTLDLNTYDRGTCFNVSELPFPYATNNDDFIKIIDNFDESEYRRHLSIFNENVVGSFENGNACESIYQWMKKNKN